MALFCSFSIIVHLVNMSYAFNWVFTLNNPTPNELGCLGDLTSYLVYGEEVGQEGTLHYQGYACFLARKRLTGVKKLLIRAHWEIMRGTPLQASEYCKKDGKFTERGVLPLTGAQSTKRKWEEILVSVQEGRFEDVPADIRLRNHRTIQAIRTDAMFAAPVKRLLSCDNEWYWGEPGTGKTQAAFDKYPDAYLKPANKWWDNYRGEKVVIIDDIDENHHVLCHHLKQWADVYPFPAEIKGSMYARIRPEKIIVTSNLPPEQIFHGVHVDAIRRRFIVTKFSKLD